MTHCAACHAGVSGRWIALSVADSGSGISRDQRSKIFDPFYTTKDVGKGTGLGLSVIHGIMHPIGGHILVGSDAAGGTAIKLLFQPCNESAVELDEGLSFGQEDSEQSGAERILIVDDEPQLAEFLGDALDIRGYQTKVINESRAALELFRRDPRAFDLLITDQTMPGITGLELISEVRKLLPDIPVVLITGYSAEIDAERAERMNIQYLQKPLQGRVLADKVSGLFDSRPKQL